MPAVTSFLISLSQWDKQEIEEKLNQRVEFSKRAIGKLLQVVWLSCQPCLRVELQTSACQFAMVFPVGSIVLNS